MNDEITDLKLTKSHLTEYKASEFFTNLHHTQIYLLFRQSILNIIQNDQFIRMNTNSTEIVEIRKFWPRHESVVSSHFSSVHQNSVSIVRKPAVSLQ